jgi:hypothetical protein
MMMKKEMLASMVNRPIGNGVTGIQAAVAAKKMRKREEKVSMMVEADMRSEMREQMNEYMIGSSCR